MTRINSFLHKQCYYLLQNERYALFLVAILAVIPFASWLSLAIIALITLRTGEYQGFKVLLVGVSLAILASHRAIAIPYTIPAILITFLLGYLAAWLLRVTASLKL